LTECFAPELFASTTPLRLAGCRCNACATVQFPVADQCAHCAHPDPEVIALPARGSLYTWTVQRFAPKPPYVIPDDGFVPFLVGYVDLGEVLVEGPLLVGDAEVDFGLEVSLVRYPVSGADGAWSYAFCP
jgi:uncharacterized OB-fold protein